MWKRLNALLLSVSLVFGSAGSVMAMENDAGAYTGSAASSISDTMEAEATTGAIDEENMTEDAFSDISTVTEDTGKTSDESAEDIAADSLPTGSEALELQDTEVEMEVTEEANAASYTVTVKNYSTSAGSIRAAVWSDTNWQDDLLWITLQKNAEGNYEGSFQPSKFKHNGKFYIDVYDGKSFVKADTAMVSMPDMLTLETTEFSAKQFTVKLSDVYSPAGVKTLKAAVWTQADGQDDLIWYTAEAQEDGTYLFTVPTKEHGKQKGEYEIHCYLKDNNGFNTFVGKMSVDVPESEIPTSLEVTKQSGSKYQIQLTDEEEYDNLRFAVWSDTGWQDDLQWYTAKAGESENVEGANAYSYTMDLKNHKHAGKFYVDAYDGKSYVTSAEFTAEGIVSAKLSQEWTDEEKGSWKIVVSDIENAEFVKKVQVPTWSQADQSDMIWYDCEKQADGTYVANIDAGKHAYHMGSYISHVYVTDSFGDKVYVGKYTTEFVSEVEKELTVTPNANGSWYTVKLAGYLCANDSVKVAIWSDTNWQDDLHWITMKKQADGSYQGSFKPADFKHNGLFYFDCYDGKTFLAEAKETISQAEKATISVSELTGKGFLITLSDISSPAGVQELRVAVWSEVDGQDDLLWQKAEKQDDGTYQVYISKGDHKRNTGVYLVDSYLTDGNGFKTYTGGVTVTVPEPENKPTLEVTKTDTGYHFETKYIDFDHVASVSYAVWSKVDGQDDLVWYEGSYDAANDSASYDFTIDRHKGLGTYYVHFYVVTTNGTKTGVAGTTFDVAIPSPTIKASVAGSWYRVDVGAFESPYKSQTLEIAVWSASDQSNLKWLTATKKADGGYYINSHTGQHLGYAGGYKAHVYLVGPKGDRTCIGTTQFDCGSAYNLVNLQCDNGNMKLTANFTYNTNIKNVYFPTWSEKDGQDDLLWYQAEKQDDGSWVAYVNIGKHNYVTGKYITHCYVDYTSGERVYTGQTSFTVDPDVSFYTVVNSQTQATGIIQGFADAGSVQVKLWSNNGGKDDVKTYTAKKSGDLWKATFLKANHIHAGFYTAELYVDGEYICTDTFSFDDYRTQETFHSISTAHAAGGGGADHSAVYTNCVEAIEESYAEGFRTIELDVTLTSDGQAVMYHTWNTGILDNYTYSSATTNGPTYSQFMNDTMYGGEYNTSDYREILQYLADHPDVSVLMDTKYTTEVGVRTVYNTMSRVAADMGLVSVMRNQIIPYFFNENMYNWINTSFNFREYHYATYAYGWNPFTTAKFTEICQFCKAKKVTTLSMWDSLATKEIINIADSYGITVYVHTTDSETTAAEKLKLGAAGIITNRITPSAAEALIGIG